MFRKIFNSLAFFGLIVFIIEHTDLKNELARIDVKSIATQILGSSNWKNVPLNIDYTRYDEKTNEYFKEIVFESEFSNDRKTEPRRWTKDVKIYMYGDVSGIFTEELTKIVGELNEIIDPIELFEVASKKTANCRIFLGTREDFIAEYGNQISDDSKERLNHNSGFFFMYYDEALIFINTEKTNGNELAQRHLLREELTQSLGLCNDSYAYPESMFYQPWSLTTEYAEIDKRLIDMLYN